MKKESKQNPEIEEWRKYVSAHVMKPSFPVFDRTSSLLYPRDDLVYLKSKQMKILFFP